MTIAVIPVTFFITIVILPYISLMLTNSGAVRQNYMGKKIPVGMGIVFIPAVITGVIVLVYLEQIDKKLALLNLLGITVIGFAGIVDDLLGNRDTLGFKGHIKSLFKGTLTTGGFKALMGGLVASVISLFISDAVIQWILNALIISLFTNMLNLMDLRPGRAIKFFFLVWGISVIGGIKGNYSYLLFPLAGSLIAYMPVDFKGKGMMGDVGSNVLGISMGIYFSLSTGVTAKICIVGALVLMHLIGEKYSFTNIIDKNRILSFVDSLGTVNRKGRRVR